MGCCVTVQKNQQRSRMPSSNQESRPGTGKFVNISRKPLTMNYETIKILGEGAFGNVTQVRHKSTGLMRAAKQIRVTSDTNENDIIDEINMMRLLDHPNIVKVFEIFHTRSHFDIVMELCTGGELFDKIIENKHFDENTAARYILELMSALNHMHSNCIVHRDIKPENLILQNEERDSSLKLADFGTATHISPSEKLTLQIGTSYYIAPEVLNGSYTEKCDVWSTGVIMYILLCGSPPFNGRTEPEIFKKIISQPLKFQKEEWSHISEDAKDLIEKMLQKNFRNRPGFPELLKHPWLQLASSEAPSKPIAVKNLNKLCTFNLQNKLMKATLAYISSQLMAQEDLQEINSLFEQMDSNKDGMLSKEELAEGFQKYGVDINIDVEQLLQQCDDDGNGFVNYNEFIVATIDWTKNLSREKLYEVFKAYDSDMNGSISLAEMKQALGGGEDHYFMEIIQEADVDNNGEIDFEEFCTYIFDKFGHK